MATATDVLRVAAGELGYSRYSDPEQGTKFGRWYAKVTGSPYFGTTGVPYCAMFASWCFSQAGATCAGLPAASTTAIYNAAKAAGALVGSVRDARPGDVLLMDWLDGDGFDHTCLCEKNCGSYVQTIEGNVGGGEVQRRTRDWGYVRAVVRPDWGKATTTTTTAKAASTTSTQPPRAGLLVDGDFGKLTVKALQTFLNKVRGAGLLVDGDFGKLTVKAWQSYLNAAAKAGLLVDGDFGKLTIRQVQLRLRALGYYWYTTKAGSRANCDIDGSFGPLTVKAVQRALNDGKL